MGNVKWLEGLREIAEDYDVWSSGWLVSTLFGAGYIFEPSLEAEREGEI
jgi:hypothetical protein